MLLIETGEWQWQIRGSTPERRGPGRMTAQDVADLPGLGLIDHLVVAKGGYFYRRKKRLTDKAIGEAFRQIRKGAVNPSQNLFRHDRVEIDGSRWSAIAFVHDREPGFLEPSSGVKERVAGFVLIVERGEAVAVFKAGLDLPPAFKAEYFDRVPTATMEAALAHGDAIFEKIRLRNMSTSKHVLRSKSLESADLQNVVGPAGTSRYVPQSYSLRREDGYYSTTPSTGRIAHRADKVGQEALVSWASQVMDILDDGPRGQVSAFIRGFARPVDLSSLPTTTLPTSVTVNVAVLAELFLDDKVWRLVRDGDDGPVALTDAEISAILTTLDVDLAARKKRDGAIELRVPGSRTVVGRVKINKARIALRALDLPGLADTRVEDSRYAVGEDPDAVPFRTFLDANDLIIVLFSDHSLAYLDGDLFRDEQLSSGGGALLRHLQVNAELARATSEKGSLKEGQPAFDPTSVFGIVATAIARSDDFLVCDDLGDEWADFIGLGVSGSPRTVTFYHAKHGELSLSASAFHVSVSQAMKNLGRMALPAEDMHRKFESWSKPYANFRVKAAMPRMLRGNTVDLRAGVEEARSAPDALRRAYIVTSSLSKKQVAKTLKELEDGIAPPAHFIQLYWLLMSFFSACSEVGAVGFVVCQE